MKWAEYMYICTSANGYIQPCLTYKVLYVNMFQFPDLPK